MAMGSNLENFGNKHAAKKVKQFNMLLAGVGGEGVLLTSVIIARAANLEGYEVGGTQLHGLAQRGGSTPVDIRFGRSVHSPLIPRGEADLIFGLEPIETARYCYFASKNRTNFFIDNFPLVPGIVKAKGLTYPSIQDITEMIYPFAKKIIVAEASNICVNKFGSTLFGNIMSLGIVVSSGMLPLKEEAILEAIKITVPRNFEENEEAFRMGLGYEDKK
jgi:indolepyruvate ferredoxin oxidoreductase, beta subunit